MPLWLPEGCNWRPRGRFIFLRPIARGSKQLHQQLPTPGYRCTLRSLVSRNGSFLAAGTVVAALLPTKLPLRGRRILLIPRNDTLTKRR